MQESSAARVVGMASLAPAGMVCEGGTWMKSIKVAFPAPGTRLETLLEDTNTANQV